MCITFNWTIIVNEPRCLGHLNYLRINVTGLIINQTENKFLALHKACVSHELLHAL